MLEINETAKRAIATNGGVFHSMVAMEECSELIQAISKCILEPHDEEARKHLVEEMADVLICLGQISKCIREPHDEEARKHLVEEMADVLICLGQLKSIYRVTDWELQIWTSTKLDRLERRLNHAK